MQNIDGIIYAFDSSDKFRLSVVSNELDILLNDKENPVSLTIPILIFANKADLVDNLNITEYGK